VTGTTRFIRGFLGNLDHVVSDRGLSLGTVLLDCSKREPMTSMLNLSS
jgi:hypothetical protein